MRTADPDIYAVGDAVEIDHFVTKEHGLIPLAGPANKQGRIAADNIAGLTSHYKGTQGSGILKVFDLAAAFTGINERSAKKLGLNYQAIHLHPADHAGYYPGAQQMSLKLLFERSTGRILGAQAVGPQGVDKRIDVIATAMRAGLTVTDLQDLELCYAPPFGSAKDPVNMAGYIAGNIMAGTSRSITYDRLHEVKEPFLLNVCFPDEWLPNREIPGATTIPLPELRGSLGRLPRDRPIVVSCMVGVRAHVACRILQQEGFGEVYNLSGGYRTFLHYTGG
jgi:rhodanese-related sulfurtransferase